MRLAARSPRPLGAVALAVAMLVATMSLPGREAFAMGSALAVTGLATEAADSPLGIDVARPRLSWRLESPAREVDQRHYRVVVASAREKLSGRPDVWDSGRVASARQWADYAGPALTSRTRYFWTVTVWTNVTAPDRAEPATFETAFLDASEWAADWIAGPALVGKGRNAIGVALGRGGYGRQGFNFARYDTAPWHADPELRLELHVTYKDGSSAVVRSDRSWQVTDGPSRFDDLMRGENHDARRAAALEGWSRPGFDDAAWPPVRVSHGPAGNLVAQNAEPIRPQGRLPFKAVTSTGPGRYLFDLRDQIAGTIVLDGDLPEGVGLQIRYGEKLRADGTIDTAMIPGGEFFGDLQKDVYIGRSGRDVWRPEFSYKGFRYVEITGLAAPPALSLIRAEFWHNDVTETGTWRSSSG